MRTFHADPQGERLLPKKRRSVNMSHARRKGRQPEAARLLNEFLVSLAMLFLALGANFAILHSATKSSEQAALSDRGLELAQSGMEQLIADPKSAVGKRRETTFGAGKGQDFEASYVRKSWVTVMESGKTKLARATVVVEWNDGRDLVRLERYVRTD